MPEKTCPTCGGAGEIYIKEWKTHVKCSQCKGKGTVDA